MFKALILQARHNLSDARMEFMIRDRLSSMRFLGFDLGAPTPDENTLRHFRNRPTETGTPKRVMKACDWQLRKKGYIPIAGQIVEPTATAQDHAGQCPNLGPELTGRDGDSASGPPSPQTSLPGYAEPEPLRRPLQLRLGQCIGHGIRSDGPCRPLDPVRQRIARGPASGEGCKDQRQPDELRHHQRRADPKRTPGQDADPQHAGPRVAAVSHELRQPRGLFRLLA